MEILNRKQAKQLGLKTYFNGISCSNGHLCERLTSKAQCLTCAKDARKRWATSNPNKMKQARNNWKINNPDKVKTIHTRYAKTIPHKYRKYAMDRQARKLQATPIWVNQKELEHIYLNCPEGYEVDHIIPLRGKTVSGLHVPWNLQYLTKEENLKKSNKVVV